MTTRTGSTSFQWWILLVAAVSTICLAIYCFSTSDTSVVAAAEAINSEAGEDTTLVYPDPNDPAQVCTEIMGNDPVCARTE